MGADNEEAQFILLNSIQVEIGWSALCLIFKPLGFFAMVGCLSLFTCIVYYCFIKKYVPPTYYWLAVFLYVFTPELMLLEATTMRQTVAIGIFLISINYIYKKDFLRYASLIFLASLFHISAIILLPIYFLGMLRLKTNTLISISIFLLFFILYILKDPLLQFILWFLSIFIPRFEYYQQPGGFNSGFGIIFNLLIMIIILIYHKYQNDNDEVSLLLKIAILNMLMIQCSLILVMLARIGYYFSPSLLAVYPFILAKTNKILPKESFLLKYVFMVTLISFTLFKFWRIFQSEIYGDNFAVYNTIFSSSYIY